MPVSDERTIEEVLRRGPVAVVGCSATPGKVAHEVPAYLLDNGFDIVPVNPNASEIFGRRSYPSLSEVDLTVEVVEVFRPSDEVPGIVDEAIARDDVTALWLQLGIGHDAAVRRAEDAGLTVVQDRCMRIEHRRLLATTDR